MHEPLHAPPTIDQPPHQAAHFTDVSIQPLAHPVSFQPSLPVTPHATRRETDEAHHHGAAFPARLPVQHDNIRRPESTPSPETSRDSRGLYISGSSALDGSVDLATGHEGGMRGSASTPALGGRGGGARGAALLAGAAPKMAGGRSQPPRPRNLEPLSGPGDRPLTGSSIVAGMNEMTRHIKVGAPYGDTMTPSSPALFCAGKSSDLMTSPPARRPSGISPSGNHVM